jgi:amidase
MKHVEDLFQNKVDVIVSPGTPCCAPILKADALSNGESNLSETGALMRYMIHGNFTGLPAIVFPIAYDDETSLPISLQVQAAHWREDLLFRVAEKSQNILTNGVRKPTMYVNVLEE